MLHKTGNKYKTKDGLIGLLTTFMMGEQSYCMLTTIADFTDLNYKGYNGNRYQDPVKVDNPYNVTEEEMKRICGSGEWEQFNYLVTV